MENYRECREKAIREILTHVYEHKSLPQNAYEWDTAAIVKECVDEKFLENVQAVTCMSGHTRITATCPYVTTKGLAYIFPPATQAAVLDSSVTIPVEVTLSNAERERIDSAAKSSSRWDKRRLLLEIIGGVLIAVITFLLTKFFS